MPIRSGQLSSQLAVGTILLVASIGLLSNESSRTATEFEFTGLPRDYVVPADVCQVQIEVMGAAGGRAGTAGTPGRGARAVADFTVTPGETLRVRVGGLGGEAQGSTPGAGGWNGGGAGGRTVDAAGRPAQAEAEQATFVAAAMDSRTGSSSLPEDRAAAAAGLPARPEPAAATEATRSDSQGFALLGAANPATGGNGGTQTHAGEPGRNAPELTVTATAGALGAGGTGAPGRASGGGGGGGGHYGGGGGGSSSTFSGGHGGGGSGLRPHGDGLPSRRRHWFRASVNQLLTLLMPLAT